MKAIAVAMQWMVRLTGLALIVLGLLFWTGRALTLVPLHMLLGLILVLTLWVLTGVAARAGASGRMVALGFLWGIVVLGLGMGQARMLVGPAHWIVRVLHLLVGLAAMGMGEAFAARAKRAPATPAS
jgi:hypothetical protein